MELDWSTFVLEVLNFLVLVWILKRFLYKPVLNAMARRKTDIEETMASAQRVRGEAEALQTQYESRLSQWNEEREAARESLRREIAEERERLLASVQQELEREKEKARVLDEKLRADALRKCQEAGVDQGARFVAKLLSAAACPELETRLFELALDQIGLLPQERRDAIRLACAETREEAVVATAYPLEPERRRRFAAALRELLGMPVGCRFHEDAALIAGLRVTLGPWVFLCNLQDELKDFTASVHEPD